MAEKRKAQMGLMPGPEGQAVAHIPTSYSGPQSQPEGLQHLCGDGVAQVHSPLRSVGAPSGSQNRGFTMRLISRAELKDRLDRRSDLKLVFALGEWQYQAKHIPGSLNLPCPPRLYASKEALEGLDRDDEIVVYCSNELCVGSISVYYFLVKRGFKNVSRYAGGLLDWQEAGYPLDGALE
jgi:rhodanese-related sulfurtransferase